MKPTDTIDTGAIDAAIRYLGEERTRRLLGAPGVATTQALRYLDERLAVQFAARLLAERLDRATIRDRLMARYGISERSAYRRIDAALKVRQTTPLFGTQAGHAAPIDTAD